jgi:hypothetical protein
MLGGINGKLRDHCWRSARSFWFVNVRSKHLHVDEGHGRSVAQGQLCAEAKAEESIILVLARFSPGNQTFDPFTTS